MLGSSSDKEDGLGILTKVGLFGGADCEFRGRGLGEEEEEWRGARVGRIHLSMFHGVRIWITLKKWRSVQPLGR